MIYSGDKKLVTSMEGFTTGDVFHEYSPHTGRTRTLWFSDGQWIGDDDPYWDLPEKPLDVDEPLYEQISHEMIHDTWGRGTPVDQFISEVRSLAAKAPKGRPVFVKYDKESDYEGGYYYFFEVGYERSPTKKERAEREKVNRRIAERDKARKEAAAENELKTYEKLKAKFETRAEGIARHTPSNT